jgi:sulfoxide reductase heme-binding subunit YedZ
MNPHDHIWWLISRSAGITALIAMTASVILGLALAGRVATRPHRKSFAALHEQLSLTSLVAIAIHGEALLGDPFLNPGIAGIAIPGVIDFKPLAVAAGIVGGYLAAFLGLSFYARRHFGGKRWRTLHRWTVAAWALAVLHTVFAGTDAQSAWLRMPLFASVGVVAALFTARLLGTRSGSRRSSTPQSSASAQSPAT